LTSSALVIPNPLNCEREDRDEEDFSKIDDYPVEWLCNCQARLNADARFYTTAIAMDDIDAVRRHLGNGRLISGSRKAFRSSVKRSETTPIRHSQRYSVFNVPHFGIDVM
jgi:hypothetical protein